MFQMQHISDRSVEGYLRRQNTQLKQLLRQANCTITALKNEIEILRKQLSKNEKTNIEPQSPLHFLRTPKMKIQQHFQGSSSEQQTTQIPASQQSKLQINYSPLAHSSTIGYKHHDNSKLQVKKVTICSAYNNIEQDNVPNKKNTIKALKKSTDKKRQNSENNDSPYKSVSTRDLYAPNIVFSRQYTSVKSQRVLFRKTSNSKPIFQHFFVTGMTKNGPCVSYSYPYGTTHNFDGYLNLMYGENSLRQPDLSPSGSKNKLNISNNSKENAHMFIRDTFVIPIMKAQTKSIQRDYLIICEVEQNVLQRQYAGCHFPRYYCFLSQWKFFSQFKKLTGQLIDRIHSKKMQYHQINENTFSKIIRDQVEQGLGFLYQKTTDYNKILDCCIGNSGLKFSADVPPQQSSYQMIEKYQAWKINNLTVQFRVGNDELPSIETELLGVLVAYALAQVKIVIYSSAKSKISQALLQLLEVIRPLAYVNPIIVATLKDEHQNFLDAPMSLILGLWSEQKKSTRQKIEIFMNKKMNLMGLIEKAKLDVQDGIIINLDTGLIFGGGIDHNLTEIAIKINNYRMKFGKPRQNYKMYKMIEKMLQGKFESQQSRQIWLSLLPYLEKTQIYCYYLENRQE